MSVAPSLAALSLDSFLAFSIPVDAARLPQPEYPLTWPRNSQPATEASSASSIFAALAESVAAQPARSAITVTDAIDRVQSLRSFVEACACTRATRGKCGGNAPMIVLHVSGSCWTAPEALLSFEHGAPKSRVSVRIDLLSGGMILER